MDHRVGGLFWNKVQKAQCVVNVASETLGERGWGKKEKMHKAQKAWHFCLNSKPALYLSPDVYTQEIL